MGWSIEPAQWLAALPSPHCCQVMPIPGTAWWQRCHPPGVLAEDIPAQGFTSTSIPPTEDRQLSQLPRLLCFALGFETMGEAELCTILPPCQVISASATAQAAPQPALPTNEELLVFLFFLSLVSRGGGDWQGAAGKATWPWLQVWGWPCSSPEWLERCHGCGQQDSGAGWDGGGLLQVGAEVGWVQGGESTYRPHWCSQPTSQRTSESPPTAPHPQDPDGSIPQPRTSWAGGGLARHQLCPRRKAWTGGLPWLARLCQAGANPVKDPASP